MSERESLSAPGWLRCFDSRPSAVARLVCFPHAGGSAAYFRTWARAAVPGLEVHAVQYPGRADRLADPPHRGIRLLAVAVVEALAPLLDRPVALFGHSMGATVAYEAARRLSERGTPPAHLFVSASRSPHREGRRTERVADRGDDALVAALRELGGTEVGLLADPQIRELVLPYVRDDFRLVESYRHQAGPLLGCPIGAFGGDRDPVVGLEELDDWADLTTGPFTSRVLSGDHFYLATETTSVLTDIQRALVLARP